MKGQQTRKATVKDPVCGMDADTTTAKHTSEYDWVAHAFCILTCKRAFEDDPQHDLQKRAPRPA